MIDHELISHDIYNYGYHIKDNFLDLCHYQALCANIKEMHENGLLNSAKIGLKNKAHHNEAIRTDEIFWLDHQSTDPAVQAYLKETGNLAQRLNQSLFLGLIEFETHFAAYKPGSYYKKHVDQFTETKDRKISCVYYLNQDWHEDFGGELMLYNQDNQLLKNITPQGNRFICFNSELPHEVCLTHQTRYSITGWMKTRSMSLIR